MLSAHYSPSRRTYMSLLRTIKKNITRNRAKTLPFQPKRHPMKLEQLEPRLLLSGSPT